MDELARVEWLLKWPLLSVPFYELKIRQKSMCAGHFDYSLQDTTLIYAFIMNPFMHIYFFNGSSIPDFEIILFSFTTLKTSIFYVEARLFLFCFLT